MVGCDLVEHFFSPVTITLEDKTQGGTYWKGRLGDVRPLGAFPPLRFTNGPFFYLKIGSR